MAEDNQPVEIPDSKSHTDHDFMTAIDAQMEAIDQKAIPPKEVEKVIQKPAPKIEDEGEKIEVKTDESLAKEVEIPPEEKAEPTINKEILNHEGKRLKPITIRAAENKPKQSIDIKTTDDVTKTDPQPEPEKESSQQSIEVKKVEPTTGAVEKKEPEPAPLAIGQPKQEDKTENAKGSRQTKKDNQPQPLKTFDTVQYHLPIKPTRHHRKHTVSPMATTFLIVVMVILVGLAAIDMEVLDIGVNLPFDLL